VASAVRAAEETAATLDSMSDYSAAAVLANGRQFVDRTLEAIKDVPVSGSDHLEAETVFVTADLTLCHAY
jgi:hypothetical protein